MQPLTAKQQAFVREYLVDLCATAAARRAGYSARTAKEQAAELMRKPQIAEAITEAQKARADRTEITADNVLRDLWAIAQADARELVELRRTCCRYCWGAGFRYQRTAGELERDREAWEALDDKAKARLGGVFDEKGGPGYHAKRDPNPECPECFGDGREEVFVHDTRKLSPTARRLFAGIKQTKDGLEIKTLAQDTALVTVGKHLGMFRERVEHSGPDGKPLPAATVAPVFNVQLTVPDSK